MAVFSRKSEVTHIRSSGHFQILLCSANLCHGTAHKETEEEAPLTGGAYICLYMQARKAQDPDQLLFQEQVTFIRSQSHDWSLKMKVQVLGGLNPCVIIK